MQPKLYNWVRAIRTISLISAVYSSILMAACVLIFFTYYSSELSSPYPYSLLIGLLAIIIASLTVRRFYIQRLVKKFNSSFRFESLLTAWCILLVLLHMECQLLFLMLFQSSISPVVTVTVLIFGTLVMIFTWPKLETIQSLLKNAD